MKSAAKQISCASRRWAALSLAALLALVACGPLSSSSWAKQAQGSPASSSSSSSSGQQPLAGLDKILKQANGVKVDAIVDPKLAINVTNVLNDMAMNLRQMLVENKRLSMQVQDLVTRVQNATGVNATRALGDLQRQQPTNISGLASSINFNSLNQNLSALMPRFGL